MPTTRRWGPVVLVLVTLAVANAVSNRLLPDVLYVPWSLAVAAGLLVVAVRIDGRAAHELGLAPGALARGLRIGGIVVAATAVVLVAGALLPATRDLFDDQRIAGQGLGATLFDALVRVPLGTVLLEEVAFRGVLPAVLTVRFGGGRAVLASAGLFGLWHVLPAMGLGTVNPIAADTIGEASVLVPVTIAVVGTTAAGLWLWWLRRRSGSLAAPALAHWASNGLGYVLAYAVSG